MIPTREQRRAWGRMGALILHGSGKTNVKPAHEALRLKWEREADPEGLLPPDVRARRGAQLRRAFLIKQSLKAAEVKRARRRNGMKLAELIDTVDGRLPGDPGRMILMCGTCGKEIRGWRDDPDEPGARITDHDADHVNAESLDRPNR